MSQHLGKATSEPTLSEKWNDLLDVDGWEEIAKVETDDDGSLAMIEGMGSSRTTGLKPVSGLIWLQPCEVRSQDEALKMLERYVWDVQYSVFPSRTGADDLADPHRLRFEEQELVYACQEAFKD